MIYTIRNKETGTEVETYNDLLFAYEILRGLNEACEFSEGETPYILETQKDLFEYYEEQPEELQRVLKPYAEHNPTYESLEKILKEVQEIGYTFEYGLSANPYNLRKM